MKRNRPPKTNRVSRQKHRPGSKPSPSASEKPANSLPSSETAPSLADAKNLSRLPLPPYQEKTKASHRSTRAGGSNASYGEFSDRAPLAKTDAPARSRKLFELGKTLCRSQRLYDGVQAFRQCLERSPGNADAHFELGRALMRLGAAEEARDAFLNCLIVRPGHAKARWHIAQVLPRVYENTDDIAFWRRRTAGAVSALAAGTELHTSEEISDAANGLFSAGPNFLLGYQQKDDRSLQEIYGRLTTRIAYSALGKLALPVTYDAPGRSRRGRIRIGYASETLCTMHTISTLFGTWITRADRDRFAIYVYHLGDHNDANTAVMHRHSDVFRHLNGSIADTVRSIRADDLDVLVYPDLGMGRRSYMAAALRLAPIQCVSWGHPVTTGLPTVDYFLSSALMEPAGSEAHYSEKLVLLPNLSIYAVPRHHKSAAQSQDEVGVPLPIPVDSFVFLCSQASQKYLPDYDEIFPRIASRVPGAKFVFINHGASETSNEMLRRRLFRAFRSAGCDPERHLIFLPWQSWPDYLALNARSDVFLDSVGWSGGNTTLEALAHGVPVVTMPGEFMRGRHSYAMLKRMGLLDCIANSIDDYVEIAVSLANDAAFRFRQKQAIADGSRHFYRDRSAIEGLERFYQSLYANGQS